MSILNAIKEVKRDNNNLQDMALLPQYLIMQMAQRGEIQKELVPLIISKKAEIIEANARNQALANSGQTPPTIMEQDMMQIAQAENPAPEPQMMPPMMDQAPMAQLPEDVGIAQNPTPPMQLAGGGIIAFAPGGDVDEDDDDDESYEDYLDELQRAKIESMILNTYQDTDTGGAAYAMPSMLQSAAAGIKAIAKEEKGPDDLVKRLQAQIMAKESGGRRYDKEGNLLTSSKGALGEMQVMPYTSKDPGFGIKPARSNDPDELRRVGDEYAAAMYKRYGDPKLAMIAYNMGPGATDKWLAAGADPRKLPKETQGYIRGVSLAGGGPVKHFVLGDLVMDDYGSSRGSDPRTQATFDEYNRTAAELEEEEDKKGKIKKTDKPLSKEAQRALTEKAAREAKVKGVGPVRPSTPAGIGGLRGATIPSLGLGAVTSLYGGLTGPDQVNIPTAADANAEGLTADEIANAKRPALIYPRIRGKERYTSELPATRDQKPRPIVVNPAAVTATAANKVNVPPGYTPDEAGSPYIGGMPPMVSSSAAPAEAAAAAPMSATDKLFAQMQDAYAKREARLEAARKQDPWLAGLAAGLGMLGGTSPYAMVNIGQGGGQGVAQYAALQRARAAEEAGLGNLQNKMYNSAMLGELRRDQMEQAKAGKESKMSQDLQIAKNAFIEKRLRATGMDEIMLGNLKRKQAMGKIGADELKLLDYYENQRRNIELEANRIYASPGAGMKIVGVRG
jgi:hypothetical protein